MREITKGELCEVVCDGVGQATYPGSLDCLKPRGMFVSFGNASGPITNFNLLALSQKGSLYATRPTLATHVSTPEKLAATAGSAVRCGAVRRGEDPGQPDLSAQRGGAGAPRPRRPPDDGFDGSDSVIHGRRHPEVPGLQPGLEGCCSRWR